MRNRENAGYQFPATCVACGEPAPRGDLNRYGECTECTDAAEGSWGF